MTGNTFGKIFRVTTFGESHQEAIGVVIDGIPAGIELDLEKIKEDLERRKPGKSPLTSPREEEDEIEVLSGIFQGKTTGSPIAIIVRNKAFDSKPYEERKLKPRPGHADLAYWLKYGFYDYRGGGRASGRETVARVIAGSIAKQLLAFKGIEILSHTLQIGKVRIEKQPSFDEIRENSRNNEVGCADPKKAKEMEKEILKAKAENDSVGGIIEVIALNVPPGLGEPVFDKLDANLAKALMSIPAVKAVEIGSGFKLAEMKGSEANDQFYIAEDGKIKTHTNHAGGILGGISTGMPIIARLAIKPTSSIGKEQFTVNLKNFTQEKISITGKHDPCIVPRVLVVAEAMMAITLLDHLLLVEGFEKWKERRN